MILLRWLKRLLILVVVLALLAIAAVAFTPAAFLYRHLAPRIDPSIQLTDITGTIGRGRAGQVSINGFPLGSFEWRVHWSDLFRREIGLSWALKDAVWSASARTTRERNGILRVDNMAMELPAMLMQPVLDIPALNFLGTVNVELDQLRMRGRIIEDARGRARWTDAGVTGSAQARFGPIHAHFASAAPGVVLGEVEDEAGPLAVDGQFELNGLSYRAEVILQSRDPGDPVSEVLYYVGQSLPDGGSLLIVEGALKNRPEPGGSPR